MIIMNKQIICYKGNFCTNLFEGKCMCKGVNPLLVKIRKCEDYHERNRCY